MSINPTKSDPALSNDVTSAKLPKIHPPLEVPAPSPKIPINHPEFKNLTAAEKLNDRNYRERVYETYPNEFTCACEPIDRSFAITDNERSNIGKFPTGILVCRSGCENSCCSSVRQSTVAFNQEDNANKNDKTPRAPFAPTYCVGSSRCNVENIDDNSRKRKLDNGGHCGVVNRLRGGGENGDVEGAVGMCGRVNRAMFRSSDDAWNGRNGCDVDCRHEADGDAIGYEYTARYPLNGRLDPAPRTPCYTNGNPWTLQPRTNHTEHPRDSHLDTMSHHRVSANACASAPEPRVPVAPGCCCPGRETHVRTFGERRTRGACAKKPCPGVDCLIKTFRETQQFVESLGKVPGLAGLGLMDPADSPYFGRDRTKNAEAIDRNSMMVLGHNSLPNPQCTGPCNPQILRSNVGDGGGPFSGTTPFTIKVPGRGGIVREAVPEMPGPGLRYPTGKSRKKDDKDKPLEMEPLDNGEMGPCGEPTCKAKRRKTGVPQDQHPVESSEDHTKKTVVHANINGRGISRASNKAKGVSKLRSGRGSLKSGPGGDRVGTRTKSMGKSTGRRIHFVYSAGDAQVGVACGHKDCTEERRRVPWNMGWLWNLNQTIGRLKPRVGWKPGAIARHVSEILREAKANTLVDLKSRPKSRSTASSRSRSRSAPSRGKRVKPQGDRRSVKKAQTNKNDDEDKEEPEPPPTLYIHRKDGTYYVTMYPIKQDTMDIPKLEVPMKPLQFKISKNKDETSVATSSTASDMEIEFSPPAAVNRYKKKPNVVHVETQVKQQEIIDAFKKDTGTKKEKKKGKKGKK